MEASEFFTAWENGVDTFEISSSGSTGKPKIISLDRKWMLWSAEQSGKVIRHTKDDVLLCCLPLNKVGGLMVLVRSKVWHLDVEVMSPVANPLLNESKATIASFTPYQLEHILSEEKSRNRLKSFKEVLIGGAEIPLNLMSKISDFDATTTFRHSYGMSETYSHIALRTLKGKDASQGFKTFEDVRIEQDADGSAIIYAPFSREGLKTKDRIEWFEDGSFILKGRNDFIINTGGVKINAEELELIIERQLKPSAKFIISSRPDSKLGQSIVLVTENKSVFENEDWAFIKAEIPYGAPKSIIELEELPRNEGDKIDRLKIRDMIEGKEEN